MAVLQSVRQRRRRGSLLPEGMPAYPATTQQLVGQREVRRLVPGLTLEATIDLENSAAIWLDLGSLG